MSCVLHCSVLNAHFVERMMVCEDACFRPLGLWASGPLGPRVRPIKPQPVIAGYSLERIDRWPRHLAVAFADGNGVAYGVRDNRAKRATRGVRWQETT